jgi:hypothetical protein
MRILRNAKHLFIALLLPLVLEVGYSPLCAQPSEESAGPVIKDIAVETVGAPSISKDRVLANLATKVGKPYSERTAEQDENETRQEGEVGRHRCGQCSCCKQMVAAEKLRGPATDEAIRSHLQYSAPDLIIKDAGDPARTPRDWHQRTDDLLLRHALCPFLLIGAAASALGSLP